MRKFILQIFVASLIVAVSLVVNPAQTEVSPKLDFRHFDLNAVVDFTKPQITARADFHFVAESEISEMSFAAESLEITSVSTLEGTALAFGKSGSSLKVTLGRIARRGEKLSIRIVYAAGTTNFADPNSPGGTNGRGLRFNAPTSNDPLKKTELWSSSENGGTALWIPVPLDSDAMRTSDIRITAPKGFSAISSGRPEKVTENSDGTKTFRFVADQPYRHDLTTIAAAEFVNVARRSGKSPINSYGYAEERDWIAASTVRIPEMAAFLESRAGVAMPFGVYSQVFVQDIGSFIPGCGAATITENMIDDYGTHADYFYLWDLTEMEALALQWYGCAIAAEKRRDAWFERGFAHFMSGWFNEFRNGRDEFLLYQHSFDQGVYLGDWNSGKRRPLVLPTSENAANAADNYPPVRGALVLQLLRFEIGEAAFARFVRQFSAQSVGRPATTEAFRSAAEKAAGRDLGFFFDQWIYQMGHPVFEVEKSYDASRRRLSIKVRQTQKRDAAAAFRQTEFFRGRVAIEIDHRIEIVELKPTAENVFEFAQPRPTKFVNFDYQSSWIKEVSENRPTDELIALIAGSRDIIARNNAVAELVARAGAETADEALRESAAAALRQLIASDSYWRLRFNAVSQLALLRRGKPDARDVALLKRVAAAEKSWLKANAVRVIGLSDDPRNAELFISLLGDPSDRVIASAAVALGRTKSPRAFAALEKLTRRPSMKSQSLLSALAGLKALGDPRGFSIAFDALNDLKRPRWRLPSPPPSWDFRPVAVDLIVSLGRGSEIFPLLSERIDRSLAENDIDGAFNNLMMLSMTKDPRGAAVFVKLKTHYKDDQNTLAAIAGYEERFAESIKK